MKRHIYYALTFLFGAIAFGAGAQDLPHHDHDTLHVDEITISANREQTLRREAPALINIVTPRTMTAANAVCLAQTLDFMPGLRVEDNCQNCGFTQVRINGLDGHYSQILIDSKPIFSSLNGVYGLEQIPAEMIGRIEVMRGGGSALFGASAVAAFTATNRLEQLVQQPFGSMSMALSTYAGQNIGAGRKDRVIAGFKDSLLAMLAVAAVMTLVMRLAGDRLVGMFVHEADVIALGGRALRITSLFYAFLGVIYVTRGVLNGVGDAMFSIINGIVEIAGRVGFPLLLLGMTDSGVWTIWETAGLTWMLAGVFCVLRYVSWSRRSGETQTAGRRLTVRRRSA